MLAEWCPALLFAFDPVLIPPTPSAPCDALSSSSTNIALKQNDTSKAALGANNKQIMNMTLVSSQIADRFSAKFLLKTSIIFYLSSLPPSPIVEEYRLDVSQKSTKDVTHESVIPSDVSQKPKRKRARKKTKHKKRKDDEPKKRETAEIYIVNDANADKKRDSFADSDDEKKLDKKERDVNEDMLNE